MPPGSLMAGGGMMGAQGMSSHAAMLAQHNQNMEHLERRRERERQASAMTRAPDLDYDSGDERDSISSRSLALMRFKRNHELMTEIFNVAAKLEKPQEDEAQLSGGFEIKEVESQVAKLESDLALLKSKADARREAARTRVHLDETEMSMTVDEVAA